MVFVPLISIILIFITMKYDKLMKFRKLLYKIFWINEFEDPKHKEKPTYKFLILGAKFGMYFYLFSIYTIMISLIIDFDAEMIISTVLIVVIFPVLYRLVMGFQRKLHGV